MTYILNQYLETFTIYMGKEEELKSIKDDLASFHLPAVQLVRWIPDVYNQENDKSPKRKHPNVWVWAYEKNHVSIVNEHFEPNSLVCYFDIQKRGTNKTIHKHLRFRKHPTIFPEIYRPRRPLVRSVRWDVMPFFGAQGTHVVDHCGVVWGWIRRLL